VTIKTKKSLNSNEKVLHDSKLHWIMLLNVFTVIWFLLAMTMLLVDDAVNDRVLIIIFAIVPLLLFILARLPAFLFTDFVITDKRFIGRTGMIRTHELNAARDKVDNIDIKRSLMGRILNYGKIEVRTVTGLYIYKYIRDPETIRKCIHFNSGGE